MFYRELKGLKKRKGYDAYEDYWDDTLELRGLAFQKQNPIQINLSKAKNC